ncbi:MAG: hypothetical protein COA52_03475 [Hyphomicrobiales bacterium]|nr:MAG: hypothetical protein COA52_03475 [Hyphomicrobiales bacterium]
MATLVLSTVGAAIGSTFGSVGAVVGRAIGALAGRAIDQALLSGGSDQVSEGPRLGTLEVQSASEGIAIPKLYGRARLTGEMIWATKFEEIRREESSGGGKGGAPQSTQISYSYFANFAIGLCEGEIGRIGRIWADGKLLDTENLQYRVYTGSENQQPDPLIEAKQGTDVPAYRGLAYVVFERLPLERFGNRIPQLAFEVFRPISGVEKHVRAICMIPGSTEFGYDTKLITREPTPGTTIPENRHTAAADTDWSASLDDLQAICPNLESVALVVSWFGSDLRCGQCSVEPGVEIAAKITNGNQWGVAGQTRASAKLISTSQGSAAFGSTPDDDSVIRAIQDLKARGLRVIFYPFLMMDIPAGNQLPNPYSGQIGQSTYPWRGEITCDPAPGQVGSPDKTPAVQAQIDALVGQASPADFTIQSGAVSYSGPTEWTLRRQILHYAKLCDLAGGVDTFLIGSELRGLTWLRAGTGLYPFVQHLQAIAADVRTMLSPQTNISYAADWSEYFGHQPPDGSGDLHFHLDPLWSDQNINFIGIDNYMPLADWREGRAHLDGSLANNIYDRDYLRSNIAGGEGFDWYYASAADRDAQIRTPITDGAYNKSWVYRYKDLKNWWSNPHINRVAGVEVANPTGWVPQSKPFWFTETGCPAVDKGANQPNVFVDPKSANSAVPHYSQGLRDDTMQRRFIEATLAHWDSAHPDYTPGANPISTIYNAPMLAAENTHLWTWDARPYPAFPGLIDIWADGENWRTGHWLTGRLGALGLDQLVAAVLEDFGFYDFATGELSGVIDGFVIDRRMSARSALEPLARAMVFDAVDAGTLLRFRPRWRAEDAALDEDDLVRESDTPLISISRAQEVELPSLITVQFNDVHQDYRRAAVSSRRLVGQSLRESTADLALVSHYGMAENIANRWLQDAWLSREQFGLALPPSALAFEPGDIISVNRPSGKRALYLDRLEDAGARKVQGRSAAPDITQGFAGSALYGTPSVPPIYGQPLVAFLNLPLIRSSDPAHQPHIAVFADPWPGAQAVYQSPNLQGFSLLQAVESPARMGELLSPLSSGPVGRWSRGAGFDIQLYGGALQSLPDSDVLAGKNLLAVLCDNSVWELLQFANADLLASRQYRLSHLLRGQLGSEDAMASGAATGARCVLIDTAVERLDLQSAELGLALNYRIGPASLDLGNSVFVPRNFTVQGRGLKPLSPVHVRAKRLPNGDLRLVWIRRTREDGDPWDLVEVPLGEASEAYRTELLNGAIVVRQISSTIPETIYSLADQITDFGQPVSQLDVKIFQISATHGDGTPAEVTLNVQ